MKNKSFYKVVFLTIISIILILFAIEVTLRILSYYKVSGIAYDNNLGWRFIKRYRYKIPLDTTSKKMYCFSTNRYGFRDVNHSLKKGNNCKRIIFLGDSYTAGTEVSDEKVFTSLFKKIIKATKNSNIEYDIMNISAPAWSSDQQFLYLKSEGMKFNPDFIVMMIAPNDIRETYTKHLFILDNDKSIKRNKTATIPLNIRFLWFLSNHSSFFQFLQTKLRTSYGTFKNIFLYFPLNFQTKTHPSGDHPLFLKTVPEELMKARELFKAMLLEINKLCIGNNCKLILVVLPTKMEFDGSLKEDLYQPGNIASYVENIAMDYNISFLNLFSALERRGNPLSIFISNEYHYNQEGHIFIAKELLYFFQNNQLL